MWNMKFLNAIDGAEYVYVDHESFRFYCWNGAHTINVYGAHTAECIDTISLEYKASGTPDKREAHDAIMEHVDTYDLT